MHLKISSAESSAANNCLALSTDESSIEANSVDPGQTAPMGAV